jgi:hypothetical protein
METERVVISGLVKNGVVVPQGPNQLQEGTLVAIVVPPPSPELASELLTELDAWERVSDEAWALIDQWEREEQP